MDNAAIHKKSSDAVLTSGLEWTQLQWTERGSIERLPGGGPPGCPSYCSNCNCADEESLMTTCGLPAPSQVRRPMCVVFDETDPISALERSFDLAAANNCQSTQTIFVEHKLTQTEEDGYVFTQVRDVATQFEKHDSEMAYKGRKAKKKKKKHEHEENTEPPSYYISNKRRNPDFSAPIGPRQSNVLQKMHFWRRNFPEIPSLPTVESQIVAKGLAVRDSDSSQKREKSQEREQDKSKATEAMIDCPNCKLMPDIRRKLSELFLKFDRQEAQVRQLHNAVKSLKLQQESSSNATEERPSRSSYPDAMGIIRVCEASTTTDDAKSFLGSHSQSDIRRSKVEFAIPSTPNYLLESKYSSECQLCSDKLQPVLDDLIVEVLRLMGQRKFADIMLTVLLRADNVYHVNVQERQSKRHLGCLLATHTAIETAVNMGFFKQILTYSVIDVRNTIKSAGRPFGIPFEFVSTTEQTVQSLPSTCENADPQSSNYKVCEFITKVLRMPADQIN